MTIERVGLPVCSRCTLARPVVVSFLASKDAATAKRRGGSRVVRLCEFCLSVLSIELRKAEDKIRRAR